MSASLLAHGGSHKTQLDGWDASMSASTSNIEQRAEIFKSTWLPGQTVVSYQAQSGSDQNPRRISSFDPGCVKTQCRCYDSPVILGGMDKALRCGGGSWAIDAIARMSR
jgi:hypothetical protein